MNFPIIYVLIILAALVVIAFMILSVRLHKGEYKLSPLAGLAFAFVIASVMFSERRLIGYGLIGVGVILAVVDIIIKMRKD